MSLKDYLSRSLSVVLIKTVGHCAYATLSDHAIHYEVDEHQNVMCCGCQTVGKETKTIPLNNVTDIQVVNQSSGCCMCTHPPGF